MCIPVSRSDVEVQEIFTNVILPRVQTHARIHSRNIKCPHKRADFISEVIALSWKWHRRLVQRGRDATEFVSAIATFAVRAVRAGRRVTGQLKPNDVISERAQAERGFRVEHLPSSVAVSHDRLGDVNGQRHQDTFEERLHDNTRTPVPDQAAFRCDFPEWLSSRTERDRRIISDMAMSERTIDLSKKHGISPGRVSQLRREYQEDWQYFIDELPPREALAASVA